MQSLVTIFIFCVNILITLILGSPESGIVLLFANVIVLLAGKGNRKISLVFNVISLLGLLYAWTYYSNYNEFHAPYGDDSFFFNEALNLSETNFIDIFRPYESILAIFILFLKPLGLFSFLNVLILNWMISAFFIAMMVRYIKVKFDFSVSLKFLFCFVILNYLFQDILVHLYRDALIYGLIFVFLINYEKFKSVGNKKNLLIGLICVFLIFVLRGANCLLLLFYVFLDYWLYSPARIKKVASKTTFSIAVMLSVALILGSLALSSILINSISRFGVGNKKVESFSELSSSRQENFFEKVDQDQNTVIIYKLGVAGYPLRVLSQIYSPISFKGIDVRNFRVSTKYSSSIVPLYTDYTAIFYGITIFLWIYVLPIIIVGIYRTYKMKLYQPIFIWFFVSAAMVAFVSLQSRHRLMFMVIYLMLLAIQQSGPMNKIEAKLYKYGRGVALVTVLLSFSYFVIKNIN
ncbi:hypothetical protein D7322_26050 [Sphingobacterium puteale]|uniref:Glycosyltransferase RgtA/B/C/D-like domain-containing protein n=1 Tax=Sphingobacterium puteale TaxID=2420510 RepID=A0A420VQY6_9SPHI|nr:hypothetical protein [Sphingobacterium puteale]RKO68669.1 hypothetical protein D7322_26050 [Sphingobacterium puteale]